MNYVKHDYRGIDGTFVPQMLKLELLALSANNFETRWMIQEKLGEMEYMSDQMFKLLSNVEVMMH